VKRVLISVCCVAYAMAGVAEDERITLYYWAFESDLQAPDLIRDFESLHDGSDGGPVIKVVIGQSASVGRGGDPQRLLCSVAGGDPPDLVKWDRFTVGELAAANAFEPLTPFIERDLRERRDDPLTIRESDIYPPCWQESVYQGVVFAIPSDTDNRGLYYNLDAFDRHAHELIAAGCVDPDDPSKPAPPRNWRQLRAAAEILTEYDEDGKLSRVGFIPMFGNTGFYTYAWLNGGRFISEDGLTCTLGMKENAEALVFLTEIYDMMGGAQAVSLFQAPRPEAGELDLFLSGRVAMQIQYDGYMNQIANNRRDMRFGVTLAPAPEGMPQFGWCGGFCWVIPRGAHHPEEAWELVKYLASRRAYRIRADSLHQAARASGNVFIPQVSPVMEVTEWAVEHYLYSDPTIGDAYKDAMRALIAAMPTSKYRPVSPVGQLLSNEQERVVDLAVHKRYDADDPVRNAQMALDVGAKAVQTELDRIFRPPPYPPIRWQPIVVSLAVLLAVVFVTVFWRLERRSQVGGFFRREHHAGYLFAAPWFFGFLVFGGGPILFSAVMSFAEYDVLSPPKFVGLKNYITLFTDDPLFYKALWNTAFMGLGIPLGMAIGLGIAMLLSHETRGMAVYRTFFYLPAIMPAVAASILWAWILNPEQGILNALLGLFGIPSAPWLHHEHWSKPGIILMGLWGSGASMIIWLAGLKGIPGHLYEAAEIDGAGPLRKFWSVTLPMLSPYILFNLVMGLIGTFQIFTQALIMTKGGPLDSTLFYAYALFNNAFRYMRMGYASAMAWVLFGIVFILTMLQLRLSRLWVHYESDT
jgi:multiple sugar transport system permease protein/multiple sugar transport system substrate-binding protein